MKVKKNMPDTRDARLGTVLVQRGLISEKQLEKALKRQQKSEKYLGELLIADGAILPEEVYKVLSEQLDMPYISLNSREEEIDLSVLQMVPEGFARRFTMLPFELDLEKNVLKVAAGENLDVAALDSISSNTGCMIESYLTDGRELLDVIEREYARLSNIEEDLQELLHESDDYELEEDITPQEELEAEALGAPVVRFVNLLIHQAIEKNASDLHIEPQKSSVEVRARIDGVLHKLTPPTKAMFPAVISRIKILSGLDISERRLPQDGKCSVENKDIDIRVSTLPTIYGEKVVMRLLDKTQLLRGLAELGFEPEQQAAFEGGLRAPQGIILNTGPTGSGKTTTLYSGLNYVRSGDRNIVTVEDPVEYEMSGTNQVQVKPRIGLTFAGALRSILRQDPDIVMIGEIRDLETAEIAVRASLTGHLVLSTIHTNSAVATINRLQDMGVKPYMLGSCLNIIMAQRLVRRICKSCKEPYDPAIKMRESLGLEDNEPLYKGKGCSRCLGTGYSGRVAIYELLKVTKPVAEAISVGVSEAELFRLAIEEGMITLHESGLRKVKRGLTTPEELVAHTIE